MNMKELRIERNGELVYIVNFWDIDGTMLVHQFPNGKKLADDITKTPPFPWVMQLVRQGNMNVMVSGRTSEYKDVSLAWWKNHAGKNPPAMYYKGVDWDVHDTSATRLEKYVECKRACLKELLAKWGNTLQASGVPFEFRIYEDDKSVLAGVSSKWDEFTKTFIVVDGARPRPYGFHDWIKEHE